MSRYGGGRRSGWRLAGKVLGWLVVALLVAAGALGGGIWLYLNESVAAVRASDPEVIKAEEELVAVEAGEATNAIVIGYDARQGEEADVGRSDTVMLLRADPKRNTLSLLSFPRDLVVEHPGCPGQGPWVGRINEAYSLCGPSGTVRTVKELTGLQVNYVIVVNFHGFKRIVNEVGGVYVDVDRRYFNDNSSGEQYATINLRPGYQKLTGGAALDYARFRHTDSDFHRIARQQVFVKAFKQQVSSSFSVLKLPGIIDAIVDNVEVGRGGKKKLDLDTVLAYARFLYDLPSGHFFQARIEGLTGFAELSAPEGAVESAVRDFLNPDVEAADKATQAATGRTVRTSAPKPSEVTVEVLNGNGEEGAADNAAYLLGQRGYLTDVGGNALDESGSADFSYFTTQVLYDPAQAGADAAAKQVANLFGEAEVVAAEGGLETMLRVVVGQTFHGTIADAPVDDTPEHQPPAVVRDPSEVLSLVAEARRVDFKPLVPTVKEQSSVLDPALPFRAYRVEGHDAIRIVYRTGAGLYWGIQQTSWTDAPVLAGANVERKIAGRTYRLYFDGSRLYMVAFEENGAAYWVSNTLLHELSNETMLAIAKGLKPLSAVQ
jgi:LCP family protein required for cell wall assembly